MRTKLNERRTTEKGRGRQADRASEARGSAQTISGQLERKNGANRRERRGARRNRLGRKVRRTSETGHCEAHEEANPQESNGKFHRTANRQTGIAVQRSL